jgi:hypothetical protein
MNKENIEKALLIFSIVGLFVISILRGEYLLI